ncbi:LysR family transcriptional regulator [Actinoplanes philippinensis]|uniref:DNA-binding transcriptional regulator, LysR family n=1 Tax=Actinoplanes philippinensis TaxID=35752 RepID=A0A1I2G7X1_9ACTN|nr:LysR family transcriptional regulator [Actinoplanes philippinensis]GIE76652.1 LysR family transcriptional regulator [Actinoplanes philippinensis]SFF13070.1 DNA-binding transcriptional regulator, LysR family [Actinoplanes philippinensis]
MTVDLRHLRVFLAIAAEGSVTRAAARLHVTQPALSRTLQQLEAHLGVTLADRSTHHLELTAAGTALRERAAAAVAAVDDVLDPARAGTWPLRLGHAWSALGEHTGPLLRAWDEAYPDVPLRLLRIDDRTAGLTDDRTDAAVLRDPGEIPRVRTECLLTEARLAAVPADGELARRPRLSLADLAGRPIAINTVTGTTTLDLWPSDAAPAVTVEVANTDDWLAAISAGRAVGVTSVATAAMYPHPAVAYVPLTDAPPLRLYVAWREPPTHPAVPALIALLRTLAT